MDILTTAAAMNGIQKQQAQNALDLLSQGATIPFIARYRKEQTGSLDEDQLAALEKSWKSLQALEERKESICRILQEKGQLNPALQNKIDACTSTAALEELYRPFKEKKKTRASAAIEAGFEPLARKIALQKQAPETLANAEGLEQAGYILAEEIAADSKYRKLIYNTLMNQEHLQTALKKDAEDQQGIYEDYYDFSELLSKIPPHRILAANRGEKEKVLSVSISHDLDGLVLLLERRIVRNPKCRNYFDGVIKDALSRLMLPSIKREIRSELKEKANDKAIAGFAGNLEHLLMTRPVKGCRVLAWDPGYINGCKLALLDPSGTLLETQVIYPFGRSKEILSERNISQVRSLIDRWKPQLVVIGNGTASRESQELVGAALETTPDIAYVIGSEAGASVYSASAIAKEEFPDLPVEKRSAVSIGRRVQDPLSELVKIDPQSLGIGEYQHDVPQKQLKETLEFAADKAVNRVGVNINTASPALLRHVSGLTKPSITKLCKVRALHPFTSRQELSKVLSAKVYEQAIGFLRIPGSDNPLDRTGIHPESYDLTMRLLDLLGLRLSDLMKPEFKQALSHQDPDELASRLHSDSYTVADILKELQNPGLDPRDSLDGPILNKGVLHIEDLHKGMQLEGTVRNVTSFGAFVDIGLHEDGLVHISHMARRFIKDPSEVVHTGQIVTVYVLDTDVRRKRISLSLLPETA